MVTSIHSTSNMNSPSTKRSKKAESSFMKLETGCMVKWHSVYNSTTTTS